MSDFEIGRCVEGLLNRVASLERASGKNAMANACRSSIRIRPSEALRRMSPDQQRAALANGSLSYDATVCFARNLNTVSMRRSGTVQVDVLDGEVIAGAAFDEVKRSIAQYGGRAGAVSQIEIVLNAVS